MAAVLTYAIGDIHGSYTKLANLLRHCTDHCGGNGYPRDRRVDSRLLSPASECRESPKNNSFFWASPAFNFIIIFSGLCSLKETQVTQRSSAASFRSENISQAMKLKWQQPDYRAKRAVCSERRRNEPTKAWTRRGVPNGYTREQADLMWLECRASAEASVKALEDASDDPLHPYAREALIVTLAIMRSALNQIIRLKAARLFLEFTRGKPKARREVSVSTAEEWIEALVACGSNPSARGDDA